MNWIKEKRRKAKEKLNLLLSGKINYDSRRGWQVKVECWFCGHKSEVPLGNHNCWDCPACEQYNGFTKDGDYNKPIPAQHIEDLNYPVTPQRSDKYQDQPSVLCELCQRNQLLKVKQLADFVPYDEASFDLEVEAYRRHLDVVYRLCRACERKVGLELARQDSEIRQYYYGEVEEEAEEDTASQVSGFSVYSAYIPRPPKPPGCGAKVLQSSVVLCAITLFLCCCVDLLTSHYPSLLDQASLQFNTSNLSNSTQQLVRTACDTSPIVVFLGFFLSVFGIMFLGKEWVQGVDVAQCLAWLGLVLLQSLQTISLLQPEHTAIINSAVALVTFLLSLHCLCLKRESQLSPKSPATFKKFRSPQKRISLKGGDLPSVSANSSPAPSETGDISEGQGQQPDDLYSERLDSLSLGSPPKKKSPRHGIFGQQYPAVSSTTNTREPHTTGRHPVITPARFVFDGSTQNRNVPTHNYDLRNRANHTTATITSRLLRSAEDAPTENSARCEVGSTSSSFHSVVTEKGGSKCGMVTKFLIGLSIGLNLCLMLYVMDAKAHSKRMLQFLLSLYQ